MKTLKASIMLGVIGLLFAVLVLAAPKGPGSLTEGSTQTRTAGIDTDTGYEVNASGGNLTQLNIDSLSQTSRWQGYYGNITGSIILDDANNNTFYDWALTTPTGEVYATNHSGTITWTLLECLNNSADGPGFNCSGENEVCLNITTIEQEWYGMNANDSDGVDETFDSTGSITVGDLTLSNCPATRLYENSSQSASHWNELLLTQNNTHTLIYAAIVENNQYGFNNETWDFQMLVGDNGDDDAVTPYYFYVELA